MVRRVIEKIYLTLLAVVFGANAAIAVPIEIRSGEHEGFSRLVMDFPAKVEWQFGKVTGGFEFRTDRQDITFSLENIFRRIPRDRIKSVEVRGAGRLFLAVDCDCHGDAFDLRDGVVVLDIKDGAPLPSARVFNRALPELEKPNDTPAENVGSEGYVEISPTQNRRFNPVPVEPGMDIPSSPTRARNGLPLFVSQEGMPDLKPGRQGNENSDPPSPGPNEVMDEMEGPKTENSTALPFGSNGNSVQVTETEMALLEQIGRAASQGVLEPDITETDKLIAPAFNQPVEIEDQESSDDTDLETMNEDGATGPASHFSVQTGMVRDPRQGEQSSGVNQDGLVCPDDELFDIKNWGVETDGAADLGSFRANLLGEFDRVRSDMVLAQIRRDIFLTFGAEAKMLLRVYQPEIDHKDILLILADIVDTLSSQNGVLLNKYTDCDGLVALWAVLARPELKPGQALNTSAITAAFSELPAHLRRYLGPSLISKLISVDQHELATSIQNATNRAEGGSNAKATYLNAQIAMGQADSAQAIDFLKQVIQSGSDLAPNAIFDLLTYKISNGLEIADGEITLAASHAFELRGTDIGRDLNRLEIVALAKNLRFSDAFNRLEMYQVRGDISLPTARELENQLISELVDNAEDATFLRFMVPESSERFLPQELRSKVAKRLVDLGFASEGRRVLSQSDDVPSEKDRVLFARMALAEEKYEVALSYLVGLNSAEAFFLQALAYEGQEKLSSSAELFNSSHAPEKQLSAAWRAGQWKAVEELDSGVIGQAGRLMQKIGDTGTPQSLDTGTLLIDHELLSQSQESRDVIVGLLAELTVPD